MSTIRKAVDDYIHDLDSLRSMLGPVMLMASALSKRFSEEHLRELEESGEEVESEGETRRFNIPPEHLRKVRKARLKSARAKNASNLLPRNFLVSFVSSYDAFLGQLLTALFEAKPELLNSSGRQLTYKELVELKDLESATKYIVESEVESILRKSHSDQFETMERLFSVPLTKDLQSWPLFIELTERRNLFVHCHGKVSSQYLKVCASHKASTKDVGLGDTLKADGKYLVEAYKCLYEIGVKLTQVLWRKTRPEQVADADTALINVTYELLAADKLDLATRLLEFAVNVLPKHSSEIEKRIFTVNLAQAYKFSNEEQMCLDVLSRMDWAATSDNFKICVAVLKDQFGNAIDLMRKIGTSGELSKIDYIEWPVFRKFRETQEFKDCYKEIFGSEPLVVQTHDKDQLLLEDEFDGPET